MNTCDRTIEDAAIAMALYVAGYSGLNPPILGEYVAIYRAGMAAGMRRAATKCDEFAAQLKPYAERTYNAEDKFAEQCAAIIRNEADKLEGQP